MTGFLAQLGIREARVLAHSAPIGTPGRIHALRLRRRFQTPTALGGIRKQSTSFAEAEKQLDKEITDEDIKRLQDEIRSTVRANFEAPRTSKNDGAHTTELTINGEPLDIAQFVPHSSEKPRYPPLYRPSKLRRDNKYDQYFYDYSEIAPKPMAPVYQAGADRTDTIQELPDADPEVIAEEIDKVIETGDHHTALIAIGRLVAFSPQSASEIKPEQFTKLLKLLDAKFFFGGHIQFDRYIPARNPFYVDFFSEDWQPKHPRNILIRLLAKIVRQRKLSGWPLSKEDHIHILRQRRVLGHISRVPLNEQLHATRNFPDAVDAYNDILGTLAEGGIWASNTGRMMKQITSRHWPRNDGDAKVEQVNKGRAAFVFQQLTQRSIKPNEETMCLLMTVFAREGDMEGIKQIFDTAWGINIYKFLALGEEGIGRGFSHDDAMRPTGRLLTTIAHIFGTNQDIPLALRLMDFVSRRYSLPIPLQAWEEILERTYTLSTYKKALREHSTSPEHPRKPLPKSAVQSLWRTMTSEPYNVQPNIHMYDKIIRSLISKQRFGVAEEMMEEGRTVHKSNVALHRKWLKKWAENVKNTHSGSSQTSVSTSANTAQRIQDDHSLWLASMRVHRSRQYIRQWVRGLIYRSGKQEYRRWEGGEYMAGVVERWKLFLPKVVKYELPSGLVDLRHDGLALNKRRVREFRAEGRDRLVEEIAGWRGSRSVKLGEIRESEEEERDEEEDFEEWMGELEAEEELVAEGESLLRWRKKGEE